MQRCIEGGDYSTAGAATRALKDQLRLVGVSADAMRRAMIASYEAEMNVVIHARRGRLWARVHEGRLELEVTDDGPGIESVELAMREGWSTASEEARRMGFGAGMGLPNIRRASNRFQLESRPGVGTRLRATIHLQGLPADQAAAEPSARPALALRSERCRRCLDCLAACPTEALRVGPGGPSLLPRRCVGCTACAGGCPDGVFGLEVPRNETLRETLRGAVLVIPRALLASPSAGLDPRSAIASLAALGIAELHFVEEWEEGLLEESRRQAAAAPGVPLVAPVCPAVTALVETRYPGLLPSMAGLATPMEAAAASLPLPRLVLVPACPAQAAIARDESSAGRIVTATAPDLLAAMASVHSPAASDALPEVESADGGQPPQTDPSALRVTGLARVRRVLGLAEAGRLEGVALIAAWACDGACAGSPLLGLDPGVAEHRLRLAGVGVPAGAPGVRLESPRRARAGARLDADMSEAIRKLGRIDAIIRALPGRDCASCGAPSCAAFAEDLVLGRAGTGDCPHRTNSLPGTGGCR